MNDAEISRRLALAIGYSPEDVNESSQRTAAVWHHSGPKNSGPHWYIFDYRDSAVIWPIAERFNCFPMRIEGGWGAWFGVRFWTADTAAKAVALAVIKHHEGSKT